MTDLSFLTFTFTFSQEMTRFEDPLSSLLSIFYEKPFFIYIMFIESKVILSAER